MEHEPYTPSGHKPLNTPKGKVTSRQLTLELSGFREYSHVIALGFATLTVVGLMGVVGVVGTILLTVFTFTRTADLHQRIIAGLATVLVLSHLSTLSVVVLAVVGYVTYRRTHARS